MLISPRRRFGGSRTLTTSLALAASVALATAPLASAQSTAEADGTIAVSSLGSTTDAGSVSGSLGSVARPAYADYVALGDSYAALGDNTKPAGGPAGCARSLANYPNQLDANPAVGDLTDATCGGAETEDILTETQYPGAPPQIQTLEAGTDLVTLSIGGNDVGFGGIVLCLTGSTPQAPRDCEDELGDDVANDIADIFGEGGAVDEIYAEIAERSPNANVIATQYLPLLPAADEDGCGFTQMIGQDNLNWARQITTDINNAVDRAAERNGHASVLPTSDTDRSGCAEPEERWVDFAGTPMNTAPMHPTALGQQAMADAIAAAI